MRGLVKAAAVLLLAAAAAGAQPTPSPSPGALQPGTALELMDVDIMFVGAHPDDDMGVMATFARYLRDEGHRGAVITLTGGEGGGNAIGPESGRALGLIRAEEERRSLALAGVAFPHFLSYPDFYFTLSAEEAERRWGPEHVCDVVRRVRLQRPEVIVTMWPGPGTHGQHQMAARAATWAYAKAGDPAFCPEQISGEHLVPYAPAKLYYYPADDCAAGCVQVPTADFSPAAGMRYADLKALAIRQYRSQGYDLGAPLPAAKAEPERFLLAGSRVPTSAWEKHLLEGLREGVRLQVKPSAFTVAREGIVDVAVELTTPGREPLFGVHLGLEVPSGWDLVQSSPEDSFPPDILPASQGTVRREFKLRPRAEASTGPTSLQATYRAHSSQGDISGTAFAGVTVGESVRASFRPLYDVAGYRRFAQATGTEWLARRLPTRVPLVVGAATPVAIEVTNQGATPARGSLELELPPGVTATPVSYEVPAGGSAQLTVPVTVASGALPSGRHAAKLPATLRTPGGAQDLADLYLLPTLTIPRLATAPKIDGDPGDNAGAATHIGPKDLWWRKEPAGADDLSASVRLGYDDRFLYVAASVRDEQVVCNIAPDDVKSQLRSDAVGVTIDPSGQSQDTSSTLQAAAFPCTTEGFTARGFRDADARPGLMETTAPGMQVASRRTDTGYDLELAIPWAAMPAQPKPGQEIGLNVVLYDGDAKEAAVGANVSESGLAWAAFEWGGKQALPYLWPRVRLGR